MKRMMKTIRNPYLFWLGVIIIGGTLLIWRNQELHEESLLIIPAVVREEEEQVIAVPVKETEPAPLPQSFLISDVPFIVQAPFGEWSDPMFQDACEEASILMAQAWVSRQPLSKERAKKEIAALAKQEEKRFGHSVDTSIDDTRALLAEFFSVTGEVNRGVTITDIQEAVASGTLVIMPTDGRKLKNPNFKQPGPSRHMLVIIGYDTVTKEFIVNDPGTRKGEGYRYPEAVLFDAILDYPTGKHVVATSTDKVMLTVSRD